MSFTVNNKINFIESFQFLSSSLDSLVKNLNEEFHKNKLDLLKEKGFYAYEYMSDFEKCEEELPRQEKFYSSLTNRKINDKEYEHVLNVWNKTEMKTKKNYHHLYLKCDALLLADVFEKIRNNGWKNYALCQSHYFSGPGLSWDGMFKRTKIKLQLIMDPDMYIIFEKDTRDGISYISNRYSKTNNKNLKSSDPKQESKHIIYLDANNLYGYAIYKFLPTKAVK